MIGQDIVNNLGVTFLTHPNQTCITSSRHLKIAVRW